MLEVSQTQKNKHCVVSLHVEHKEVELVETETR